MPLEKILQEIYAIDQNLRQHDQELRKAIELMLQTRPSISIDKNFEKKLREDLLVYARSLNQKTKFNFNFFSMKKFLYAFGGVALAALVIVPLVYHPQVSSPARTENSGEIDFTLTDGVAINNQADDFDLDLENYASNSGSVAYGLGGGATTDMAMAKSSIAPYPYYDRSYAYKYVGKDLELKESQLAVLKVTNQNQKVALSEILNNFKLDSVDLNKFSDLNLTSLTLYEDRDNGYEIYVDLKTGTINIYRAWDRLLESDSKDFVIDKENVKPEEIIRVADAFIKQYGIDLKDYGEPELSEDFAIIMRSDYKPESYNVIYPLLVNGKKVVTTWGDVNGITVTVDLKTGTVSNLYGISLRTYEGKEYPATQDFEAIKKYVEGLGYEKLSFEDEADVQTVKVQTPEAVWMQYSTYTGKETKNYLVPALKFAVEYPEEITWGQRAVIVPLIKDMFERTANQK